VARLLGARRAAILPLCLGLALLATPVAAHAQSAAARIRQERDSLERVRQEREALERQARELQGRMRDLSEDVANLDRQADVTARALAALDRQMAALNDAVDETTGAMLRAEDERATKRAILRRRVTDIYKRGPLGEAEALLSVRSFGDLVSRYKYLYLVAQRDRALLERVGTLRNQIDRQRQQLVSLQAAMQRSREEKAAEEERLRSLQRERAQSLAK
jgi:septal ring factor EnvC (AmiA/AmiB activator)